MSPWAARSQKATTTSGAKGPFLHQQGLDTTTPAGKALFQMMGVFAEFERAMIQERVRAGLRRRRKDRPGVRVIAANHGVSVNTVQRIAHAR